MQSGSIAALVLVVLVFLALSFKDSPVSYEFLYWTTYIGLIALIIKLVLNPVSRDIMNKIGAALWWADLFKNNKK